MRVGKAIVGLGVWAVCATAVATGDGFAEMSLDQLMAIDVFRAASLSPVETRKAPGTVYRFTQDEIRRLGARRIEDLFQYIPGFQLNQNRKRHRAIWARGLIDTYNDKLVLVVDGVQVRHLYYGHFSLGDGLPVELVERVEIVLGPASSLYGADAFGGVVSVTTKGFSDRPEVSGALEVGGHERKRGTLAYRGPQAALFASYLDQDIPFAANRLSFIGGPVSQPPDERLGRISGRVSPMEGLTLSLDYQEVDSPYLFIPDTQDAYVAERPLTLAAQYERGTPDEGRIEVVLSHTRDTVWEYEIAPGAGLAMLEHQDGAITHGETRVLRQLDAHLATLGLAWDHRSAEDTSNARFWSRTQGVLASPITGDLLLRPGISTDDWAAYVQDAWDLTERLQLTVGGRYDQYEEFGGFFNYRVAAVFAPDQGQVFKLLYGTAIRTPNPREYLKVLEDTSFVPPMPRPEHLESLELAYQRQWTSGSLGVTLFHNRFEEFITLRPTPPATNAPGSLGDDYYANDPAPWTTQGVEVAAGLEATEELSVRATAAHLDAHRQGGEPVPYVADWTASLALDYRFHPGQRVGLSLVYNGERPDANRYATDDPKSFAVVNLFGSGRLREGLEYSYGVDNLFDRRVYDPSQEYGRYNPERAERELWARLEWRFDL